MGRKKIAIKKISDPGNRKITFNKRRDGVIKKAVELSVLCDCEVAVIIYNKDLKNFYEYSSSHLDKLLDLRRDVKKKDKKKLLIQNNDDIGWTCLQCKSKNLTDRGLCEWCKNPNPNQSLFFANKISTQVLIRGNPQGSKHEKKKTNQRKRRHDMTSPSTGRIEKCEENESNNINIDINTTTPSASPITANIVRNTPRHNNDFMSIQPPSSLPPNGPNEAMFSYPSSPSSPPSSDLSESERSHAAVSSGVYMRNGLKQGGRSAVPGPTAGLIPAGGRDTRITKLEPPLNVNSDINSEESKRKKLKLSTNSKDDLSQRNPIFDENDERRREGNNKDNRSMQSMQSTTAHLSYNPQALIPSPPSSYSSASSNLSDPIIKSELLPSSIAPPLRLSQYDPSSSCNKSLLPSPHLHIHPRRPPVFNAIAPHVPNPIKPALQSTRISNFRERMQRKNLMVEIPKNQRWPMQTISPFEQGDSKAVSEATPPLPPLQTPRTVNAFYQNMFTLSSAGETSRLPAIPYPSLSPPLGQSGMKRTSQSAFRTINSGGKFPYNISSGSLGGPANSPGPWHSFDSPKFPLRSPNPPSTSADANVD